MKEVVHFFALFAAVSLAQPSYGSSSSAGGQVDDLNEIRTQLGLQGKKLDEQQRQLDGLKSSTVDKKPTTLDIRGGAAPQTQASDSQPVGQAPEKQPTKKEYEEIEAIFRDQGVLTPKYTLVVEPSFQYSYSSSTRVVINGYTVLPTFVIGLIDVRSVNRDTYIPALSLRFGLTSRLEVNTYVPYVFRDDSSAITLQNQNTGTTQDAYFNADDDDIGDVQFGIRYQFNSSQGGGPVFIGGLLAKSDTGSDPFGLRTTDFGGQQLDTELATGTGFWAVQPSLSVILPSDPVVFFGSINYLYNFEKDKTIATRNNDGTFTAEDLEVEPGNTLGFNIGMGFAMNEQTSFSLGYEHYVIDKTKIDGETPQSAVTTTLGNLLLGASYKLRDNVSLNFALQVGVTEAAPDVQLTLRVPFSI